MAGRVRGRRPQARIGGQARTRLARAAVVRASGALFLGRGYAVTTIEAISDLSEVPPATVYRLDLAPGARVRPDIAFTARKVAVFVDGCFCHACPQHGTQPAFNT